jgi:hypothetical protein
MKPVVLFAASALALCAFCTAAAAMSTVPYSGQYLGTKRAPELNGSVRDPNGPDRAYGVTDPNNGPPAYAKRRSNPGFLNIDPFDPNSIVNSFDRNRYANPYPYDPIYNPYGQSGSPYAPTAPNIRPGQGIPYGR